MSGGGRPLGSRRSAQHRLKHWNMRCTECVCRAVNTQILTKTLFYVWAARATWTQGETMIQCFLFVKVSEMCTETADGRSDDEFMTLWIVQLNLYEFDGSVVFYLKLGLFQFGVFVQKWLFTSIQVLISVNRRCDWSAGLGGRGRWVGGAWMGWCHITGTFGNQLPCWRDEEQIWFDLGHEV